MLEVDEVEEIEEVEEKREWIPPSISFFSSISPSLFVWLIFLLIGFFIVVFNLGTNKFIFNGKTGALKLAKSPSGFPNKFCNGFNGALPWPNNKDGV